MSDIIRDVVYRTNGERCISGCRTGAEREIVIYPKIY